MQRHLVLGPHMVELCLSLKFAVTQTLSGTNIVRAVPGCAYCPTAPESCTTRPAMAATVVYERLSFACSL